MDCFESVNIIRALGACAASVGKTICEQLELEAAPGGRICADENFEYLERGHLAVIGLNAAIGVAQGINHLGLRIGITTGLIKHPPRHQNRSVPCPLHDTMKA